MIQQIKSQDRINLEQLFRDFACSAVCPLTLTLMSDRQLKKIICISMYESLTIFKNLKPSIAKNAIVKKTKLPARSVHRYISYHLDKKERKRLEDLFRKHVCNVLCPDTLSVMEATELRRLICVSMLTKLVKYEGKSTKYATKEIINALGVNKSTVSKMLSHNKIISSN